MFYSEQERLIYTSPAGSRHDPLQIQRRLVLVSGGQLNDYLDLWTKTDGTAVERARAEEELVRFSRLSFDLKPFDQEGGVVDAVALDCLDHFLRWLEGNAQREPQPQP